jgi:hypothetical protein
MAIVKGPITMTGSISNVSFYTRRGSDKVIARSKGGASKEKIKSSPEFAGFRLQQKEWKGCTGFASMLRYSFGGLHRLADYNLTPVLNGFAKELQKTDTVNAIGKRAILLSKYRNLLDGFNFNRTYPFNTVLRMSVHGQIDRENMRAVVTLPRINTVTDLLNVQRLPYFRLIVALGAVSDMEFADMSFEPLVPAMHGVSEVLTGEWIPAETILQEQQLEIAFGEEMKPYFTDSVSLVLSIAVEFGKVGFTRAPQEVKYAGSGKVICCK